jgi:hypothetical protein
VSALRWIVGLVVVLGLGAGNVLREACWTQADGFVCGPLASGPMAGRRPPTAVTGLTRITLPAPAWRPLAMDVRLSGDAAASVRVSDRSDGGIVVRGGGPVGTLRVTAPDDEAGRLALWAERTDSAVGVAAVEVVGIAPVLTAGRLVLSVAPASIVALALLWAGYLWPRAPARPAPDRTPAAAPAAAAPGAPRITPAAFAAPIALLAVVHGLWIVLRPPFQAPDEPQHHARATSIPAAPYVAGDLAVPLAAAHRNPLTWTPNRLHFIIFKPDDRLSADDVAALRRTPWTPPAAYPAVEPVPTGIASYPPLYYWVVFAGGELTTGLFDLSPYASVLAYRGASVVAAGLVWLAVYGMLLATPSLRPWALPAFVVLVANPGTAAITASVNPDALAIPTAVLLFLASWRSLAEGGSPAWVLAAAGLGLAAKPSGLLAVGAAGAGVAWWMARQPAVRPQGWTLLRILTGITVASAVAFYAWSPPRLTPGRHDALSVIDYLLTVAQRAPDLWLQYWGWLGWQEYGAPMIFYRLLLGTCLVLAAAAWRRSPPGAGVGRFLAVAGVCYVAGLLIGEYANHTTAALVLQGRYLMPLAACALPLVRQRTPIAAWILPMLLIALNVALAQATIARYFGGDWALWWRSLAGG